MGSLERLGSTLVGEQRAQGVPALPLGLQGKPENLAWVVHDLKAKHGVRFVYCWHGLPAYWAGGRGAAGRRGCYWPAAHARGATGRGQGTCALASKLRTPHHPACTPLHPRSLLSLPAPSPGVSPDAPAVAKYKAEVYYGHGTPGLHEIEPSTAWNPATLGGWARGLACRPHCCCALS